MNKKTAAYLMLVSEMTTASDNLARSSHLYVESSSGSCTPEEHRVAPHVLPSRRHSGTSPIDWTRTLLKNVCRHLRLYAEWSAGALPLRVNDWK
ncbi:hypothetical protein BDN67DRAFT_973221 [Paxillus ammoniavirescens]|nr:hypothetical protein BDN67DRAFT_973221 [Paxillus ammoniavirescens]